MQPFIVTGSDEVKAAIKGLGENAPHALRIATTLLGGHAQRAMRSEIGKRFTFRGTKEGFEKAIIFQAPRPTGRKVSAVLRVGSSQGGTKASRTNKLGVILARHEEAETRTESGQMYYDGRGRQMSGLGFFLPAKGLRTSSANVPRSFYPRNIGVSMRRAVDGTYYLAKGTKKATKKTITGVSYFATRMGVFRRKHLSGLGAFTGRVQVEAVWWFKSRVRTPARLGLRDTANAIFEKYSLDYAMDAIDIVLKRIS